MEKQSKFSESTLLPVSLVIAVIGGAGWLTMVYANGEANSVEIAELKITQQKFTDKVSDKLDEILERVTRIEEKRK